MPAPDRGGQGIIRYVQDVQGDPDRVGYLPGGQLSAGPVDGDQLGCELGRSAASAARPDELVLGVRELALALEAGDLAGEQAANARVEFGLAPGLAAVAEECQRQTAAPIRHDSLEDGARAIAHFTHRHGRDLGLDGDMLTLAEARQVGQLAALVVAARVVAEQVADGMQVEDRGETLGGPVPDDQPERISQDCHAGVQRLLRPSSPRQDRPRHRHAGLGQSARLAQHPVVRISFDDWLAHGLWLPTTRLELTSRTGAIPWLPSAT